MSADFSGLKRKTLATALVFLVLLAIVLIFVSTPQHYNKMKICRSDSDCVQATCCHASACVNQENAPKCEGIFCTQSCETELDCNKGTCACIRHQCEVEAL